MKYMQQVSTEDHLCSIMMLEIKEAKSRLPPVNCPSSYAFTDPILVVDRFMRTLSQGVSMSHLAKTSMVKVIKERKRKNADDVDEEVAGGGGAATAAVDAADDSS